ncbi:MAG: 16S rRNA (uracil(1498)-N(3))-methyltransferase [Actinomycetaceae bacterium]|nr:16S rRNA (uracil(1498)-N(3))-methyltransferase [Actinomycetaceae bacterium]MDY5854962.1 16S rRNA (uracil(1498)-N(3))-methyltransferase [Arcanobacterium sp.]
MSLPVYVADWLWEEADRGQLKLGALVDVTGSEAHHAINARRTKIGEHIEVVDGYGLRAQLEVTHIDKDRLVGTLVHLVREELHSPTITLIQALAKGGRDEQAIETASEYGVDVVMPWQADRSVVRWQGSAKVARGIERWQATALAAAKQSRRSWVARVDPLVDSPALAQWIAQAVAAGTQVFLCHESATIKLTHVLRQSNVGSSIARTGTTSHDAYSDKDAPDVNILDANISGVRADAPCSERAERPELPDFSDIALIVGPEGGVSPEEIAAFEKAGAQTVLLGEHVMRASSAGSWAIAVIRALSA